jgi:hypothetical protein
MSVLSRRARIAVGNELRDGVDATIRANWHLGSPRLIAEHTDGDRTALVGLSLSAEAAEGLALELLELAQECREARERGSDE